ncbi:exo-beta-N-acetylmuramidase NamZ family protein [Spirosoma areae]
MTLLTKLFFAGFSLFTLACQAQTSQKAAPPIQTGADQLAVYLPALLGKRVGLVVNHTSRIGRTHLVDSLLARGVTIKTIFAPEHGFRGQATDGEEISSSRDSRTGIMIASLYGATRKPTPRQMDSLDVLVFDIQDVGTRFYTYISTMQYVMEACAEANKPLYVLDRPNPNGHYVDGPVLDPKFKSFVGLNPIPVVYGLTIGELAQMINGEGWLTGLSNTPKKTCPLTVVPLKNYTHQTPYVLPVPPSPNLPNQQAVLLYPSLCFFEGTVVSVGRGTDKQFQVIGSPYTNYGPYTFTPVDKPGAVNPPLEGKACYGLDLSKATISKQGLMLTYFFDFFKRASDKSAFFLANNGIDRLAGTDQLRLQLLAGVPEAKIRKSWQPALDSYKQIRKKYLLYP